MGQMGDLAARAMLVSLNLSIWTARRYDRKASQEVAENHGAKTDAGRYHKRLIDKADAYEAIVTIGREARDFYYRYTLPWANDGARILPASAYMDFADAMRHRGQQFDQAVTQFVAAYPELRQAARTVLGSLYNPADYPEPETIGRLFKFKVSVLPLPTAGDFRVQLADDTTQALRDSITEQVEAATAEAMRDLYGRLHGAVSNMVRRLSDPDAIFRDSLVTNLQEVCDVLPKLNLTNDPHLEALRQDTLRDLCGHAPATLRDDKRTRADVAAKAKAIEARMAFYTGAGNGQ